MSFSMRRTIALVIFMPLLLMLGVCGVLAWQVRQLAALNGWVEHTREVIAEADQVQRLILDQETAIRGYALTNDRVFLSPFEEGRKRLGPALAALRRLTADNPVEQNQVKVLEDKYSNWFGALTGMDKQGAIEGGRKAEYAAT